MDTFEAAPKYPACGVPRAGRIPATVNSMIVEALVFFRPFAQPGLPTRARVQSQVRGTILHLRPKSQVFEGGEFASKRPTQRLVAPQILSRSFYKLLEDLPPSTAHVCVDGYFDDSDLFGHGET